jgi:hypothetical protein
MPPFPCVDAGKLKASSGASEVFASAQMSPSLWTDDPSALMQNPNYNWVTRCTKYTMQVCGSPCKQSEAFELRTYCTGHLSVWIFTRML